MSKVDSDLDFSSGARGKNHPLPVSAGDLVNKAYSDALANGALLKTEARVIGATAGALANISLAAPGAAIDGVSLAAGDRVQLVAQSTPSQNGPWVWNGAAVPMTRPIDFAAASTQKAGTSLFIAESGSSWAKSVWMLITPETATTVDTTAQTWTQSNGAADVTASNGVQIVGNDVRIENGGVLTVAHGGTGASTTAGARTALSVPGKYVTDIGDGVTTTFSITHGLATTDIASVVCIDKATGAKEDVDWTVVDSGHVSVGAFATAPAATSGALPGGTGKRIVVLG